MLIYIVDCSTVGYRGLHFIYSTNQHCHGEPELLKMGALIVGLSFEGGRIQKCRNSTCADGCTEVQMVQACWFEKSYFRPTKGIGAIGENLAVVGEFSPSTEPQADACKNGMIWFMHHRHLYSDIHISFITYFDNTAFASSDFSNRSRASKSPLANIAWKASL